MGRLAGKVAIITGGASGIGAASARLFAAEGAMVGIGDLSQDAVDHVVAEIESAGGQAVGVAVDVSDSHAVERLVSTVVARFGRLDVLFSNAGMSGHGSVVTISEESFRRTLEVNLIGGFLAAKHSIPAMVASGGGSVFFTASELALVGSRNNVAYTASKAALIGMARSMALDHARQGIRVNVLCPGPIDTPMLRRSIIDHPGSAAYEQMILDETPLGRIGTAQEMARIALFLASDDSSYMTGTTIVADGGATAT